MFRPAIRFPGVGVSKDFNDAIAPLRKGEVTAGPSFCRAIRWCVASVTDYQPAHPATFEEAKAEVRNKAGQDKLQAILTQKATDWWPRRRR